MPDGVEVAAGRRAHVRSDVQRNRTALLDAARELLAVRGDVPMYEIARRAGVGQATLYRHFPDRQALLGAIADEVMSALEEETALTIAPGPGALVACLRLLVTSMLRTRALMQLLEEESSSARQPGSLLHGVVERLLAMLGGHFDEAMAAGVLRPDSSLDDVVLILAMVRGAIETVPAGDGAEVASRALEIALSGLLASSSE